VQRAQADQGREDAQRQHDRVRGVSSEAMSEPKTPTVKSAYRRLPPQKRQFVDMLTRRVIPTTAVRKIRPGLKRPDDLAWKWKSDPLVQEALKEREEEAMQEAGITNAQILLGIAATADFDIRKLCKPDGTPIPIHELDDETARIVQGVEVEYVTSEDGKAAVMRTKYKLPMRNEARKMLGQAKKLFVQKHEHELGELTLEQLVGMSGQEPPAAEGAE
jgi:hypothetical protein